LGRIILRVFSRILPELREKQGAKFDKSFSEAAYTGTERFKAETGIACHEVEITNDSQRVQALST